MKHILILLAMFFFIGCQCYPETTTRENRASMNWRLEYFHKVKIQNEELYECVYVGVKRSFSILSNTACEEKL